MAATEKIPADECGNTRKQQDESCKKSRGEVQTPRSALGAGLHAPLACFAITLRNTALTKLTALGCQTHKLRITADLAGRGRRIALFPAGRDRRFVTSPPR